ncbi:MAG: AAA family ATPase [Candidatus Dependentiae bacterium]|nr:AAA family ATPase [Candidatus Dependentiae bacterium]
MLSKLPVDLSTFSELRKQKYLYVDKTKYAHELITGGRRFFLSRPRRFGKTLFVSTLKEILLGNKELFDDLWIATSDYTWPKHGLITLDLSTLGIEDAETLKIGLKEALIRVAREYTINVNLTIDTPEFILYDLVKALKIKFGRVGLLIDEYDNPILHSLKDAKRAVKIRDGIRRFFAAIKGLDAELDFVFITGVSNFAKAGLFSGLNNLQVITLDDRCAYVCGYTQEEVDHYFKNYLTIWANKENIHLIELQQQIKHWYNGYNFSGKSLSVYNPFSLMKALDAQSFKNFWFQSGAPTFLVEELENEYRKKEYRLLDLDSLEITEDTLGIFDVGSTPLPSLMFQTGYLTIVNYDRDRNAYKLGYPNFEVKTAKVFNITYKEKRLSSINTQ